MPRVHVNARSVGQRSVCFIRQIQKSHVQSHMLRNHVAAVAPARVAILAARRVPVLAPRRARGRGLERLAARARTAPGTATETALLSGHLNRRMSDSSDFITIKHMPREV
jgi:hypothetical protein